MPDHDRPTPTPGTEPPPKSASLLQVVGAVFWSFFGIRKGDAMSRDMGTIKPLHVIIVGVALAAVLVFCLLMLVRFILRGT